MLCNSKINRLAAFLLVIFTSFAVNMWACKPKIAILNSTAQKIYPGVMGFPISTNVFIQIEIRKTGFYHFDTAWLDGVPSRIQVYKDSIPVPFNGKFLKGTRLMLHVSYVDTQTIISPETGKPVERETTPVPYAYLPAKLKGKPLIIRFLQNNRKKYSDGARPLELSPFYAP